MGNTLDQSCSRNFSNRFTEHESLPILIKTENVCRKYPKLFQINTENYSLLQILPNMIIEAFTAY